MGTRISDETRKKIISDVLAFGKPGSLVAAETGVSVASVYNIVLIAELLKNKKYEELKNRALTSTFGIDGIRKTADALGISFPENYIEELEVQVKEKRATRELKRMRNRAEQTKSAEQETSTPQTKETPVSKPVTEETPIPQKQPVGAKFHIPAASAEMGWQTRIKCNPNKVAMTVYFNGVPVVEGLSRVKGNTELDLMQAISYAAHMCYKLTEQKKLAGR